MLLENKKTHKETNILKTMAVDAETKKEIKRQAGLYEIAKEEAIRRIQDNVRVAKEKLKAAEIELLDEVEVVFDENPFEELLTKLESENPPTDAEVRSVLARGVPKEFGPSEESYRSLLEEIEAFKSWREKAISVPFNVRVTGTTRDSITLTWDAVYRASLYQIEVDGSNSVLSTTNAFTKTEFLADTEHNFRVRAVRERPVSNWSDVVKGRTQKESFETSGWKECPDYVDDWMSYSVDEVNPRVATNASGCDLCTITGNTPIPLNAVTSWSIKVLKSEYNGFDIYIGVAPSDINQNICNYDKCGWYFDCFSSTLWSGPPQDWPGIAYGPRKGKGEYVHTGDSVGVVMDTAKRELSFVVGGVNLGVAYERIPLDKPLVPCAILRFKGDSVELVI